MDKTYQRYEMLIEILARDTEYQELECQRKALEGEFRRVMGTLSQNQKDAVCAYIGATEEVMLRMLALAYEGMLLKNDASGGPTC